MKGCITQRIALSSAIILRSPRDESQGLRPWDLIRARVMRQLSKVTQSRKQWKHKATQRGEHNRYQRKQLARITAERNRATQALQEARTRLRQLESQWQELVALPKVDVVLVALHLF